MAARLTPAAGSVPDTNSLYDYRNGFQLQDDFLTGAVASGSIGSLGWASGGTITAVSGTATNPGQVQLDTGAVSATVARLNGLGSSPLSMASNFNMVWILKVGTNDGNTTIRAGLTNNWAGNPANDGIYLEKADADTNWFAVTRASSTSTRTDTGIAVNTTSFITLRIIRNGTAVMFYLDNVLVAINSANAPSVVGGPGIMIVNSAAAAKTVVVDYVELALEASR